jgi:hypothetical protein
VTDLKNRNLEKRTQLWDWDEEVDLSREGCFLAREFLTLAPLNDLLLTHSAAA